MCKQRDIQCFVHNTNNGTASRQCTRTAARAHSANQLVSQPYQLVFISARERSSIRRQVRLGGKIRG